MTAETVIEINQVTLGYGQAPILSDVSFSVKRGQITALIGGSGCGKSTIVRALVGLLPPISGDVKLFGINPYDLDDHDRIAFLTRLGMLFQGGALLGSLTVGENIALPLREHTQLSPNIIARVVETKLALVGLPHAAALMPAQLSGGMRKRASLSRAMVMDPELLICDEPSAGLDPVVAAGIDETLKRLQRNLGMTMIVVTHDLASVQQIADDVVMLHNGQVLAQGSVAELQALPVVDVQHFFRRQSATPTHDAQSLLSLLEDGQRPIIENST